MNEAKFVHKPKTLKLSSTCEFTEWGFVSGPNVFLEYLERGQDHWHASVETDIAIDRDTAIKIINFLSEAFNLGLELGNDG